MRKNQRVIQNKKQEDLRAEFDSLKEITDLSFRLRVKNNLAFRDVQILKKNPIFLMFFLSELIYSIVHLSMISCHSFSPR